ncbi:MAG: glycosyltransferase family 1 protein [Patescibacteria group bacterium]|nr:glycosyltransferase family 1 protein [Patescibacteria group bacterium]
MNIGIDASRAFIGKRTGTEEYSYQFIKNLTKVDLFSHQIFLYIRRNSAIDFDLPQNFTVKEIQYNKFWTQIGLSKEMKKNSIDILFIPSHAVPFIHPKNTVVTIHGLEFKHYPECYSFKEKFLLEVNTLFSIKWSNKIIVPSESSKKDLIKFYGVDGNKIRVVYHGVTFCHCEEKRRNIPITMHTSHNITMGENSKGVAKSSCGTSHNDNPYILFIGRLEKRKNIINLIKAFELFKKITPHSFLQRGNLNYKLILAGKVGFGFKEIKKAIQKSPFKKDIILKKYVSKEEKEGLYKKADLFILLSFYEGFGLTILEAMSYGVPVICSNTSSLPEVAGKAALLINPNNTQEITEAMSKIFNDDDLRNKMIEKGFENVKKFSWGKCARETMDVLLGC